jgi:hypothetical protein
MDLLNWNGINAGDSGRPLRDVVENMRKAGALVRMLGLVLDRPTDEYDEEIALELIREAGGLVELCGDRALELLDAQGPEGGRKKRRPAAGTERPHDAPRPQLAVVAAAGKDA